MAIYQKLLVSVCSLCMALSITAQVESKTHRWHIAVLDQYFNRYGGVKLGINNQAGGIRYAHTDSTGVAMIDLISTEPPEFVVFNDNMVLLHTTIEPTWPATGAEQFQVKLFVAVRQHIILNEVTVTPSSGERLISISTDVHIVRSAANYNDPGRLALSQPGTSPAHDGSNALMFEGLAPGTHRWSINGLEIVNPNHLSNAGTFNDRAGINSGGINSLNLWTLKSIHLKSGGHNTAVNNVGLNLDQRLRNGDLHTHRQNFQVGLIGLEAGAEGPLIKDKASYLISGRYSTVGLLTSVFNVDFGGERINFYDLTCHVNWQGKLGDFSIFSINGQSHNRFDGTADSTLWQNFKDTRRIYNNEQVHIHGADWRVPLDADNRAGIRIAGNYSENRVQYDNAPLDDMLSQTRIKSRDRTGLLSTEVSLRVALSKKRAISTGFRQQLHQGRYYNLYDIPEQTHSIHLAGAFVNIKHMDEKNFLSIGASVYRVVHMPSNNTHTARPTLELAFKRHLMRSWQLIGDSRYAFQVFMQPGLVGAVARTLQSHLGFENKHLKVYAFNHLMLYDKSARWIFEGINRRAFAPDVQVRPSNFDTKYNSGLVLFQNATLARWSWQHHHTFFMPQERSFAIANRQPVNPFNTRYAGQGSITYAVDKQHVNYGLTLQGLWHGGLLVHPIDTVASRAYHTTYLQVMQESADILNPTDALKPTQRLPAYRRLDLRLFYSFKKRQTQHHLMLDVQNVTNRRNVGFYFYDPLRRALRPGYQLGLIPLLSWRIALF